jgi:acetylornithine aminotransferase
MILELVQGEAGYFPGDTGFFEEILALLRERGVAILFDEIQTFGRTDRPFAYQHFGLDQYADIVSVGKTSQVCATLFSSAYRPPPGLISQTFTGSTSSIAAACYVVEKFGEGQLFGESGRVTEVSRRFTGGFEAIATRHPDWLRGPHGLGAMLAFTPFEGAPQTTRHVLDELFQRGVIAFSTAGALSRVRFLPPVAVIQNEQIDQVLEILEAALAVVAEERGA